jgi:hypothetical protein
MTLKATGMFVEMFDLATDENAGTADTSQTSEAPVGGKHVYRNPGIGMNSIARSGIADAGE